MRFEASPDELGIVRRVSRDTPITIPTGDRRHMSHIREGKIRYEKVFARDRLRKLAVDVTLDEGGGEADNASKKPKTTKVGVRGKRGEVGKKTSLQPPKKEVNAKAAKARKRVTKRERKHGPGI